MTIPPRAFWTFHEAIARWDRSPTHICGLAYQGEFALLTGVPLVLVGDKAIAGLVEVAPGDIMRFMRADGLAPQSWRIHRIRQYAVEGAEWEFITDPEAGLELTMADLLISDSDLRTFEIRHKINGARYVQAPMTAPKYDWDEFYVALCAYVHENGLPPAQGDLVKIMAEWFQQNSPDGETPDNSTVRRRVAPLWRALRDDSATA